MTRSQILELSGRELNIPVAQHVMGWVPPKRRTVTWYSPIGCGASEPTSFIADRNAAALVLAEIEKRGLQRFFIGCLTHVSGNEDTWSLVTATPEQICRAALLAVLETNNAT